MAARPKSTQEQAEEILARPGVQTPFGLRNVTPEEARIVAQARAEAEQAAGPQPQPKVVGPVELAGNIYRAAAKPMITEAQVEALPGFFQPIGREVRELSSPRMLALTAATAGFGPTAALGLRGVVLSAGQKKVVATLAPGALTAARAVRAIVSGALQPVVKGGFGRRFAAEQALGVGGGMAARTAVEAVPETAPTPVKVAAGLVGGLVGGAGAIGSLRALPALKRGVESALVRAPGTVLPETGLRLAGMPGGMAGGAPRRGRVVPPKEPWQMRQEEFFATPEGKPSPGIPINVKHRQLVEQALSEGKDVPYRVVVQYPDIAANLSSLEYVRSAYPRAETADAFPSLLKEHQELQAQFAPPPKPVAPVAKRPWEMTRADYIRLRAQPKPSQMGESFYSGDVNRLTKAHKASVTQALSEGKPVPSNVLADYPDLAVAKPTPAVTEPVRPARGGVEASRTEEAIGAPAYRKAAEAFRAGGDEAQAQQAEAIASRLEPAGGAVRKEAAEHIAAAPPPAAAPAKRPRSPRAVARPGVAPTTGQPPIEAGRPASAPMGGVPTPRGDVPPVTTAAKLKDVGGPTTPVSIHEIRVEKSGKFWGVREYVDGVPQDWQGRASVTQEAAEQKAAALREKGRAAGFNVIEPGVESPAARVRAPGDVPPSPAAAPPGAPPTKPPTAAGGIPPADPLESRPRTLLDMNREAKGMRAMTPEQRAALMDLAKPIKGDILYQARPFNEHAQNLLGPDTSFMKALRRLPGLKQVFGAWNPAQMARDNPQAMIGLRQSIFQEIEKARIRFATLRWWHDADTAFAFKRTGTMYGAKPTTGVWRSTTAKPASPNVVRGKMFGTINDMIEHPERYAFTEEQSRVLSLADNTLTQSVRDAQRVGVNVVELAEDYWPRVITKGPKGEKGLGIARKRISSAKGYTHQRVFSDIDDLVEAGYVVETDPRRVLASRLEAGVDTVAHANARKQIAALPGVEKPLERMERRFPQVLESARGAREARDAAKATVKSAGAKATPEQVMVLRQAEADYITAMRDVYAKKIEVGTPGYYELRLPNGRIAPQELVEQVGKLIDLPELRQPGVGGAAALTREVSQLLRTTLTNVDLAAGFIQGQLLFYRNNVAWWKAQAQAIVALIDDPTAFIAKNFDIMDEGVRTAAIVAPTEFLFAKQGLASIPLRIPFIGPGLGAFNRVFEWFITAGQTELYKAARSGVAKNAGMDELVSLGSAIRKEVGTESYAILGIRPTQRTVEALSLFAARFFRAMVGVLGQSFTPGPGGAEARKAVGSLLAGGTALTIGIKWAQDKELPNMTDPYAPDWMQWRWGKTYYNAYGPFYPYLRTMARMSVAFAEGDPKKAGAALTQFLESKESLPLRALDIAGQLVYYGTANVYGTTIERTWASIAKGILSEFVTPISIQEIPLGIAEGRPESLLEFPGLIGRPVRLASEWRKDLEEYFDIPSDSLELTMGQQSRTEYRERHPEVDAKLFITGQVSSLQTSSSVREAARLIQESGIDPDSIRGIKVRKEDLAQAQKVGKKLEKTAVDRLIAALESQPKSPAPPAPSSAPPPTAVPGSGGSLLEWTRQRRQGTPAPAGVR